MSWTCAIARITVGGYRGTGALISSDRLVLTAFHVVADREQSIEAKSPVYYEAPINVVFGDPKNPAEVWVCGDGGARCVRYSIEHDWALLELSEGQLQAKPFPLAKANLEKARFDIFGFPKHENDNGGQYVGELGKLGGTKVELLVDNLPVGAYMGGISGAPCLVSGEIVGIVLQSLANQQDQAVKASLYMLAIEHAIASFVGLCEWNDGREILFQRKVSGCLPNDPAILNSAGGKLGLDAQRRSREQVARRILAKDVESVADALSEGQLDPLKQAAPILECVGAMALHVDAVNQLRAACNAVTTPLLTTETARIHRWYLERAFDGELTGLNKVVVIRARSGDEELPGAAGEREVARAVRDVVERVQLGLQRRKVGQTLLSAMLSSDASKTEDEAKRRRFWLIFMGERRLEVVEAVRQRLRNAHVVMGLCEVPEFPEAYRERIATVSPLHRGESELLEAWESAAAQLQVPIEPERDDA
jgi:hypothetical protein